jgi:hypothetical protein
MLTRHPFRHLAAVCTAVVAAAVIASPAGAITIRPTPIPIQLPCYVFGGSIAQTVVYGPPVAPGALQSNYTAIGGSCFWPGDTVHVYFTDAGRDWSATETATVGSNGEFTVPEQMPELTAQTTAESVYATEPGRTSNTLSLVVPGLR